MLSHLDSVRYYCYKYKDYSFPSSFLLFCYIVYDIILLYFFALIMLLIMLLIIYGAVTQLQLPLTMLNITFLPPYNAGALLDACVELE